MHVGCSVLLHGRSLRFVRVEVVRRGSLMAARLRGVTAHTLALQYGPGESASIWAEDALAHRHVREFPNIE